MTGADGAMATAGHSVVAGCLLVLLGGCASYQASLLSPAANAAALEARSLDDPRLQAFIAGQLGGAAREAKWDLARLTLAAVYFHPDLDIARAGLAAAEAAVLTVAQPPNPTLNLAAIFGTAAVGGAIPAGALPLQVGPIVDFVIETAGKRQYRTATAQHHADAARAVLVAAAWQVRARVRKALIDLWAAQRQGSLARRRLALQEELIGLLQTRLAAGAANALDLARERIRRAEFAVAVRDGEAAASDARARLAAAVGIPLAAIVRAALSFDAVERPALPPADTAVGQLRQRALVGRSEIIAALAEYEAAQSGLQLAIAGQYPNLTLGPGYQYDFGTNKYLLSPSLALPVFNRNEGPIAQAVAARQQAASRFTAVQAGTLGAIDRAAADYRAADASLTTTDALVADARRREERVRRSFAAGETDRPALIAAELERAAAELSRQPAAAKQRHALGGLEDALQQPLFEAAAALPVPAANPRLPAGPPP